MDLVQETFSSDGKSLLFYTKVMIGLHANRKMLIGGPYLDGAQDGERQKFQLDAARWGSVLGLQNLHTVS